MRRYIPDRVHRGAEYLDIVRPGWIQEIDIDLLDMRSGENCVLGQLFLTYWTGKDWLGISFRQEHAFGFCVLSSSHYEELTTQWRREIQDRLDMTARSAGLTTS